MTKTVPWNLNGVGLASRVTAREAARRDGTSLGEWLDRVITKHTSRLDPPDAGMNGPGARNDGADPRHASPRGIKFRRSAAPRDAESPNAAENGEVLYPRFVRTRADHAGDEEPRRLRRAPHPASRFAESPSPRRDTEAALLFGEAAAERNRGAAREGDPVESRLAQIEARLDKLTALLEAASSQTVRNARSRPASRATKRPREFGPSLAKSFETADRANGTRAPLENLRRIADDFGRGAPRPVDGGWNEGLADLDRKIGLANEIAAEAFATAGRIAGARNRGDGRDAWREIAALQRHQAIVDARTQAALNAIHEILEDLAGQSFGPEDYPGGASREGRDDGEDWRAPAAPRRPTGRP